MGTAAYSSAVEEASADLPPIEAMEERLVASATDTPFHRLGVSLCLCSSQDAYLPLCPRKWDSSIDAVALILPSGMDNLAELSEQKS